MVAALATTALVLATQAVTVGSADAAAAPTAPVALGSAASFSVLGGDDITSTGSSTLLSGDLGLSPAGSITGFGESLGTVQGTIQDKNEAAAAARTARVVAYADAASRDGATELAGDQSGKEVGPGVHHSAGAFANTGTMTLDAGGDPDAVFIFQIGGAFSPAVNSKVVLADGAQVDHVFWQVNGAVSIGASSHYVGTFLVHGAITLGAMSTLQGRVLGDGRVTLTDNVITTPPVPTPAPTTAGPVTPVTPVAPATPGSTTTAPEQRYRADASIRGARRSWTGSGVYAGTGQQVFTHLRNQKRSVRFVVRLSNRGTQIDRLQVRGTTSNSSIAVRYVAAGKDVTRAVRAGRYVTRPLVSGKSVRIVVTVTRTRTTTPLNRGAFTTRVTSLHAPSSRDAAGAIVRWGL